MQVCFDKIIDISWTLSPQTTNWKDNASNSIQFPQYRSFEQGHGARASNIFMNGHSGTHLDAPSHFLENGSTIEQISLQQLQGQAIVLDFLQLAKDEVLLKRKHLEYFDNVIKPNSIVLLKTCNSLLSEESTPFNNNFTALAQCAAQYLACEKKVKAVGIDYLGIERSDLQKHHETHTTLFSNHVAIIEGLRLAHVPTRYVYKKEQAAVQFDPSLQADYFCICLPLKTKGIEVAPARAILYEIK